MRGIVRGGNNDGKKIELDGTATAGDVINGLTFYNTDPEVKRTGTLQLTGDAAAGEVLAGKKYYDTDPKTQRTGTMTNNAGNTPAVSFHADGTSIHVIPAAGYTDGIDDAAVITDADFLASNIKAGFEIFGVTGTLRWQNDITSNDAFVFTPWYDDTDPLIVVT